MRVVVCGGHDYSDSFRLFAEMNALHKRHRFSAVITGGGHGADRIAYDWARVHGLATEVFRAEWERDGKDAAFLRNQRIIDEGKPHLVVAFPGGKGTADMVQRAKEAGIRVQVFVRASDQPPHDQPPEALA